MGELFWNWGIPTAVSIVESNISVPIIATGGIRSGIDMAKSLAIGASTCSIALPLVGPALNGSEDVKNKLQIMLEELKVAMFLTGSENIEELKHAQLVITGKTGLYLNERGFETSHFALR
jgi:isopentenyl-diphosphate delta-isomerase